MELRSGKDTTVGKPFTEVLPIEVLLEICSHIDTGKDLSEFLRCSRLTHSLCGDVELQASWLLRRQGHSAAIRTVLRNGDKLGEAGRETLLDRLLACPLSDAQQKDPSHMSLVKAMRRMHAAVEVVVEELRDVCKALGIKPVA